MRKISGHRRKSAIWTAIRAHCQECAGNTAEVRRCDGRMRGYQCALHPYRISGVSKTGTDGLMLPIFHKTEVLKAIRSECLFCCNGNVPSVWCGDHGCSLFPYQRGTGSFTQVGKFAQKPARSGDDHDLSVNGKGMGDGASAPWFVARAR
jgi:hypothetical protein